MHPPGWYPDPHLPGHLRWWDGQRWTDDVAAPDPASAAPPAAAAGAPAPSLTRPVAPGTGSPVAPPAASVAPAGAPARAPATRTGLAVGVLIAAGVLIVLVVGGGILAVRSSTPSSSTPTAAGGPVTTTTPSSCTGGPGSTSGPGGPGSASGRVLDQRAADAGIPVLGAEGNATHTHTLVVITVDGAAAPVETGIGIDEPGRRIAAVHTHDSTGVVHVESPTAGDRYTLGQFLTLAGMPDDDRLCERYAPGETCTVEIAVVAPDAAQHRVFRSYGTMPDEPPVDAAGRDTVLAQGAVIEVRITTAS